MYVCITGTPFMQYIVAAATLLGIVGGLAVGLYSVSRLVMVAAREWLLPPVLARVSPRTQTPALAQIAVGIVISILALFANYDWLSQTANFGGLFGMWAVSNTMIFRRYYPEMKLRFTQFGAVETNISKEKPGWSVPGRLFTTKARKIVVAVHIITINIISICSGIYYRVNTVSPPDCSPNPDYYQPGLDGDFVYGHHTLAVLVWPVAWFVATLSMLLLCPVDY